MKGGDKERVGRTNKLSHVNPHHTLTKVEHSWRLQTGLAAGYLGGEFFHTLQRLGEFLMVVGGSTDCLNHCFRHGQIVCLAFAGQLPGTSLIQKF